MADVALELEDDRDDHVQARLVYQAEPRSLFGDGLRQPELEVGRVLRLLAARRRITIERDELDGQRVFCSLPCQVQVRVELRGARPLQTR